MKDVGDKITGVDTSLSTHVTAPIAAVGAASLAAFKEVDEGADIVTQKTGFDIINKVTGLKTSLPGAICSCRRSSFRIFPSVASSPSNRLLFLISLSAGIKKQ